ncbi:putative von Willebrand factor protein [Gordonia phage GMA6]|uniref:Putative von Willebrand factor protein n=1 Tax=Gordonia phage GMA6 TaxID=1647285 RepID=A0A0K0NL82_9CAUD|nr:putative von Willebrand factor protein [Gordonia phage GMA6]AKL88343.1 putative von Willebrand factor protein [Gordonia phage GMA6]
MKITKRSMMLTKEEENTVRLTQLGQVFATADSALAGRRVSVKIVPEADQTYGDGTPAYTVNGTHVTINELPGHPDFLSTSGLVVANGLNYHELCHVLYTPGHKTQLAQKVVQTGGMAAAQAYNLLEDQRIEGIMTTRFTTTKHYLTATVAEYFLNVNWQARGRNNLEECLAESWPIVYGRRYLPQHMRDHFRTVANDPAYRNWTVANLRRMEAIIDEYVKIRFGKIMNVMTLNHAHSLIVEFTDLLSKGKRKNDPDSTSNGLPNPFAHPKAVDGGSSGCADAGMAGAEGQSKKGDTPAKSDGGGKGVDDGSDTGSGDGSDSPDEGAGNGSSAGDGSSGPGGPDTIGALRKALNGAMQDAEVVANTAQQNRTLNSKGDKFNGVLASTNYTNHKSYPEYSQQAGAFRKQLSRISEDADPGFDRGHDSGRLNIMRAVRGDSIDTVFDLWKEGKQDASSIELVVLLDRSYSMSQLMAQACQAAWSIKYGIDGLGGDARCSVITFGSQASYLYRPNDVATSQPRHVSSNGGTTVEPAAMEALRIMARSERKKKILISVSDGGWDDREEATEVIKRMRAGGVTTAALFLQDDTTARFIKGMDSGSRKDYLDVMRNEHEMFVLGDSPNSITMLGKSLVKAAMRR